MAKRFSVEAVFKAIDKMSAPVSRMQNRIGKFTRKMDRGLRKVNKSVGRFAQKMKKGAMIVTASLAIIGLGLANVIRIGAEFDQTLVNAAAKFPGEIRKGTAEFKLLEEAARQVGRTTEFTAIQSAEALNFLAMAGFNAEQSVKALPGVVDLATVAQADLATATDIATDSLGAFGLMTKDATKLGKNLARINDVIAKTTTTANTNVEAMFEAIKDAAPVAVSAGASIETFSALVGELANSGIKGSKAGTTLKNMFIRLAAPTGAGAAMLKKFGIKTKDASGDMRDIIDILGDLDKSLSGLGTAQKAGVLERIFGLRAIAGANVLLTSGADKLRDYRRTLEGATGASTEMASVMRDTLQGRLNALKSAIESVKISIFKTNEGPLNDIVIRMTDWVRANEELIASRIGEFLTMIFENLDKIISTLKAIGIGLAIFGTLFVLLKILIVLMTAVNLIMAANPAVLIFMAIVAAIGLVIAAVTLIIKHWDKLKTAFSNLPGPVKTVLTLLASPFLLIVDAIKFIIDNWDKITGLVSSVFSTVGDFLGFGDDDDEKTKGVPEVVSPQERAAAITEEKRISNTAEVTIKDESGKAELTSGTLGNGLQLVTSGGFE